MKVGERGHLRLLLFINGSMSTSVLFARIHGCMVLEYLWMIPTVFNIITAFLDSLANKAKVAFQVSGLRVYSLFPSLQYPTFETSREDEAFFTSDMGGAW